MIRINESKCYCGKCGSEFDVQWETEDVTNVYNHEKGMGEEYEYYITAEAVCPTCGNEINASLNVFEYPIGEVESVVMGDIHDTAGEKSTKVDKPRVEVFDL